MITILILKTELIDKAVKLIDIKENTTVGKQEAELAFDLYKELQKMNEPKKFKFYPFNEKQASEFSLDDFSKSVKK